MMNNKLEKLIAKKREIEHKIREIKSLKSLIGRKQFDEKCKIVGSFFLEQYKNRMHDLRQKLDPVLKSKRSRKLFGLDEKDINK